MLHEFYKRHRIDKNTHHRIVAVLLICSSLLAIFGAHVYVTASFECFVSLLWLCEPV